MAIDNIRQGLIHAREAIEQGRTDEAIATIEHTLEDLDGDRLLTTNEARELLGIASVNTLKLLVKKAGLNVTYHGNRMMIPVSELERLQDSDIVEGIRASDRLHAESAGLGAEGELTPEELEDLHASRPGTLPWRKVPPATDS